MFSGGNVIQFGNRNIEACNRINIEPLTDLDMFI